MVSKKSMTNYAAHRNTLATWEKEPATMIINAKGISSVDIETAQKKESLKIMIDVALTQVGRLCTNSKLPNSKTI